jgi:predicted transposase/invertase (TIGR01784 family)
MSGINIGLEKGIEKGMIEEKRLFSVNLLSKGFDVQYVAELTGLSSADVVKLKDTTSSVH